MSVPVVQEQITIRSANTLSEHTYIVSNLNLVWDSISIYFVVNVMSVNFSSDDIQRELQIR